MDISVCLIVKDEQEVLERCLGCVKQFANEIIIIDTGSKDNTKQIAKKFTDKVYDFKWVDDFSKARNFSFSFAKCEYVMWLDADDFISQDNIKKILQLKKGVSTADVYMLKYDIAFDEKGNSTFSYYRERILKNNGKFFWQGFVHEAIVPSGKIEYLDISIWHRRKQKTNPKRNVEIYEKHQRNGAVFGAREWFYFGRELFYVKRYSKAEKCFRKFLNQPHKFLPNEIEASIFIAKIYYIKGQFQRAKNFLFSSMKRLDLGAEGCCLLGDIFIKENNFPLSIFWYRNATLCIPDTKSGAFVDLSYSTFVPFVQLTYLYYCLGDFKQAQKYHQKAKEVCPNNTSVLHNEKVFTDKKL